MKIITTIFFLLFAFITSALGAEKNLICGGSKEDVMGARIYIKLIKQIDDNYGVVLERTTLKSKASINKKILENLKCNFSEIDARVVSCRGGTRTSPQNFSISIISELNIYGAQTHFSVVAQSEQIKNIDQKSLDISGIFNNSGEAFSEAMTLNLSGDYGCSYNEL